MSTFSNQQAKELWKARWNRVPLKKLISKYGADPRRFYEVWEEQENPGTRIEAFNEFTIEQPSLAKSTNPVPHVPTRQVVARQPVDEAQGSLFD